MRVIVNAAASADGKIALRGGKRLTLSDRVDFARVHRLRAEADAILVGVGTVLADDPSLGVKAEHLGREPRRRPTRVVLDSTGRTPDHARVLDGRAQTLVLTTDAASGKRWPNAEAVVCGKDRVDLRQALYELHGRGIRTLLVEGGAHVIGAFLGSGLVDDLYTYVAPVVVGGGAPTLVDGPGATEAAHTLPLRLESAERYGEGALLHWRPVAPRSG